MKTSVLGAILGLGAAGVVSAQTELQKQVPSDGTLYVPSAGYEVLYSQLDDPSGTAFIDTDYVGFTPISSMAADDFIVTSPAGWDIRVVNTPGVFKAQGDLPLWVNTTFHADAGGLPGAPLPGCDFPGNTDFTTDGTGDLSINVTCNAPPGVIWVSQQVRPAYYLHYWSTRNTAVGNPFVWKNPLDGFGTGCTDWTPASICGSGGDDTLFEIRGKVNTPGSDVPAVGPLGIASLLLALGAGAAYVLGRRS